MAMGEVRVIEPGLLTTIQDARGRPGLGRFGVPPGGAMDARAARLANRLVGGGGEEAVLEITLQGPAFEWVTGAHIALAGADLGAASEGRLWRPGIPIDSRPEPCCRSASRGAALAPISPSRAGSRRPRSLARYRPTVARASAASTAERFALATSFEFTGSQDGPLRSAVGSDVDGDERLAFIPAEEGLRWLSPVAERTFCATEWRVAPDSDRNGIR